jgi:hypothetical protein
MIAAAGLDHPSLIRPHHLVRRVANAEIRLFSQLHVFLKPGELLEGKREHDFYSEAWQLARPDSFELPSAAAYQSLNDMQFDSGGLISPQ